MSVQPENLYEAEIICETVGTTGIITLNRVKALNALSLTMFRALDKTLRAWQHDDRITQIVIQSASDRAFCAGGDVKAVAIEADKMRRGKDPGETVRTLFREEYRLNALIRNFHKPYIALIGGIVMGGGIGISLHGSHRVVTDTTRAAMPEVKIGFFPDIGFGAFYADMPGLTGLYMAMTGEIVSGRDMAALGLATHFVPQSDWAAVESSLSSGGEVDAVLAPYAVKTREKFALQDKIDRYFSGKTVEEILAALEKDTAEDGSGDEWCAKTLKSLRSHCPFSVKTAFRHYHAARGADFAAIMKTDYWLSQNITLREDFYEGVRAVLIDKDMAPRWKPPRLEDVTEAELDEVFAPCKNGEEDLIL
ncbi:MAG: enoyl-CoA hydratase/isomerase family protein [Micavibrio sp.]|nr:MAG: enoyl-CoA hydratase/isomerase family protein [Micavibrio sp.]